MKQPPIQSLGVKHVLVYEYKGTHSLQFRDGPHNVASWQVTESALRNGTYDAMVQQWIAGDISWNRMSNIAKQIRSELSA